MQKVQNFGSLLQSYSLKKLLESLGAEVHFIDIERNEEDDKVVGNIRLEFVNEMEKTGGLLQKVKKIDRYAINRIKIREIANRQDAIFEDFRKYQLKIKECDNELLYDLCIIGSDEVFNCMTPSSWGFTSQLFGNVRQAEEVITYAASCGATKYTQLNLEMVGIIKNAFEKVSGFSARDMNTKEFIEQLTSNPVENHLDPVWVGDFQDELERTSITVELPKRYCIIYSYYNRIHDKKEIKDILRFCKEKELEPIALGAPQMWLKNYVAVSPFEMLKIFQNADFIITDTFHGTIFSEKFNGHFAVLSRDSNKNKLSDLVKKINAENHVITDFSKLDEAYKVYRERTNVQKLVKKQREISMEYLKKYIER